MQTTSNGRVLPKQMKTDDVIIREVCVTKDYDFFYRTFSANGGIVALCQFILNEFVDYNKTGLMGCTFLLLSIFHSAKI